MCKRILRFTLIKQLLVKSRFFKKLPQISHIYKICNFSSIIVFFRQLLLPCKFYGSSMKWILFFQFCQLRAVTILLQVLSEVNFSSMTLQQCIFFPNLLLWKQNYYQTYGEYWEPHTFPTWKSDFFICIQNNNSSAWL